MQAVLSDREHPPFDLEAGTRIPDAEEKMEGARVSSESEPGPSSAQGPFWVGESHWYPNGETREQCQARFKENVTEQRQAYGNTQLVRINHSLPARSGLSIPFWLDPDILFRLNYGPMTFAEVKNFKSENGKRDTDRLPFPGPDLFDSYSLSKRSRVTLLDRPLVLKLAKALFPARVPFPVNEGFSVGLVYGTRETAGEPILEYALSYISLSVIRVEDFAITTTLDVEEPDASDMAPKTPCRPMAVVIHDMLPLIDFLKFHSNNNPQKTMFSWLNEYLNREGIPSTNRITYTYWLRYLTDMFNALTGATNFASALSLSNYIFLVSGEREPESKEFDADFTPQESLFLAFQSPVSSAALDQSCSIDELDAAFIESGPFKFTTTYRFHEHLTIDSRNRILIYVDLKEEFLTLDPWDGFDSFLTYDEYFLRRILDVDAVRKEMAFTKALLFTRSKESRRIGNKLLHPPSFFQRIFSKHFPYHTMLRELDIDHAIAYGNWKKGTVHLNQFHLYRARLAYIQERMKTWRPRRFSELFIPGYYDRFTWFTAIFGLVFGVIATLSLVTSVVQVVFAVLAWKATQ